MRKLVVIDFLSLDGVMQAPGQPEEDTEGGFKHGGWAVPYHDEGLAESVADSMAATDAYLFGRKTYENFAAYWPTAPREIPFTDHLNNTAKYVVSRTLRNPGWNNTKVIEGDAVQEKLFRDNDQLTKLELVDSSTTSTGGVMLTYRPT